MTSLSFGNVRADMTNPYVFGYGSYFSQQDLVLGGYTSTTVTGSDPVTGTRLTMFGSLNIFDPEGSPISRAVVQTAAGELLFEWSGLQTTAGALYNAINADTPAPLIALLRGFLQGADTISGGSASDRLIGHEGDDVLKGGAGIDVAHYTGLRSQATIALSSDTTPYPASVSMPGAGTDSLTGVERLAFSDLGVAFDVTPTGNVLDPATKGEGGNAGKAYRLYQAAFDRVPDLAGVGYWVAQVDQGERLFDIATGFIGSAEFKALYGQNPSNADYTRALYLNVLDRAPDADGYAYWNAMLSGEPWNGVNYGTTTRQQMLVDFSESAENKANVISVIGNGFDFVPWLGD